MNAARARRERSKRIALALQADYKALIEARGQDEIQNAAIVLGDRFNTNVDFIINVLRDYGGLEAKFDAEPRVPANDAPPLPKMPELLRAGCDVDLPPRKH